MDRIFKEWTTRLNSLDSETVFRQNGVIFSPDGRSFLNPCRHDKKFGSCHFYSGKAWDMAGSGVNKGNVIPNIDAVMALTGSSFLDACDTIASQNGLPTYADITNAEKKDKQSGKVYDVMPLNNKQIRFLHLQRYGMVNIIRHSSNVKPQGIDNQRLDGEGNEYYWGDTIRYTLDDLYREDQDHEGFWALIEGKVREWYPFYLDLYKNCVWKADADIKALHDMVMENAHLGIYDAAGVMAERQGLDTYEKMKLLKELRKDPDIYIKEGLDNKYTNPFAGMPQVKDWLETALKELNLLAEKYGLNETIKRKRRFALA